MNREKQAGEASPLLGILVPGIKGREAADQHFEPGRRAPQGCGHDHIQDLGIDTCYFGHSNKAIMHSLDHGIVFQTPAEPEVKEIVEKAVS